MRGSQVVAVQTAHPTDPQRDLPAVLDRAARAVERGGVAVLPEYFYKPADGPPQPETLAELRWVEDLVAEASDETEGALVATVPDVRDDGCYNTAIVARDGAIVHRQAKVRPTEGERKAGIRAHHQVEVVELDGVRLGVLVCADVLALDLVAEMARLAPDVVAVPVLSPLREADETQAARTSVFVARAWDLGAYVVKAGGYAEPNVVGRSLITAPWGVLARARDQYRDELLSAPLELERLRRVRRAFDGLGEDAPDA